MILYQRYIHHINHLLPSKLPVRQNGCVKEAEGVKYVSRVLRWVEGGDCVRRWITWGISASRGKLEKGVRVVSDGADLRGSSMMGMLVYGSEGRGIEDRRSWRVWKRRRGSAFWKVSERAELMQLERETGFGVGRMELAGSL